MKQRHDLVRKEQHLIINGLRRKTLPSALSMLCSVAVAHAQCTDLTTLDQSSASATLETQDRYGSTVTVGDFDGDGFDDLAIGSPQEDSGFSNNGMVAVHYGRVDGLGASAWSSWTQNSINGTDNEDGDRLGSVMATGDFDNDGHDDIVLGMPDEDQGALSDAGRLAVKYGSAAGLTSSNRSNSWSQDSMAGNGNASGDRFGAALAVGDFNGDDYDDVAVSAPYDDIGAIVSSGRVVVVYGSAGGLDTSTSEAFNQTGVNMTNETGDYFGSALAAGDFNDDGRDDLAIGVRGEDHSGLTNVGKIAVKFGTASGLKAGSSEFFGHPAANAVDRAYDELGEHMATGDLDGDGVDDLVVGINSKEVNGDANAGLVIVLFGAAGSGLIPSVGSPNSRHLMSSNAGIPVAFGMNFGNGVAIADLDGDGYDDIATGASHYWTEGRIAVFFGNNTGTMAADTQWFGEDCMGGSAANDQYFGQALAGGDFDGDGLDELAAGDYNHDSGGISASGAVFTANVSK